MALSTEALTTAAKAAVWLRRSDIAGDQPQILDILIDAYSRAIHRYTQRQFQPQDAAANVARTFRYDGSGYLSFAPAELAELASSNAVVLHTDLPASEQDTLDPGDASTESEFRLEPRNATPEGTHLWMVLPRIDLTSARREKGAEVTVTGKWGAGTVPADVELACLIAVSAAFRNPERFASRSLGELQVSEFIEDPETLGLSLPRDARALLAPYRRPVV